MAYTTPGKTREKVYRFVRQRLLAGRPPTVRDVQEAMGFAAVESARKHLRALVDEGRLTQEPGRARGYSLVERRGAGSLWQVPLVGAVQAGALHEAIESPEGYVSVQASRGDDLFALRVRGDSMTGAGILEGDVVVVKRNARPRDGDVVVARVGDEATVKILRTAGRRVELHPANPAYDVIVPRRAELEVLGKVIELRRSLA